MARVENWHTKLAEHINNKRDKQFEFGYNDCLLWVASCVYAITGIDHAKKVRGTYNTPEGAYRALLKNTDASNLKELLTSLFGSIQHIAFARQGDIVFKNSNAAGFDCIVGICYGRHSFFVNEGQGLVEVDTLDLDGCWWVS